MKSQNKYKPTKDGKKQIITLRPVFENSIKRENSSKIPSDIKGIYRYIDEGKIVYIGKGSIKDRLKEDQREEWKFDTIEYSLIDNDDEQFEWEHYWIEEFKKGNNNFLPAYNKGNL